MCCQIHAEEHTENSLDVLIESYTRDHPARGERMVLGMLRASSKLSFTRSQARSAIARVDDGGLVDRRAAFGRRIIR